MDIEYGRETLTRGKADVVLFSYSLSMMTDWQLTLACASSELWPGGRIGVVDFCRDAGSSKWFAEWLRINHVDVDQGYEQRLSMLFDERSHTRHSVWAGLWSFYLFHGTKPGFYGKGRRRDKPAFQAA